MLDPPPRQGFDSSRSNAIGRRSAGRSTQLSIGTVKWFNEQKGWGFITPEDGGKDLFVHHSEIQTEGFRTLQEGQKVEYTSADGAKGPQATQVRPV